MLGRVGSARGGLPPTVTLPHRIFNTDGSVWPGQDAGFLGRAADPWLLNARLTPEGYRIQEIDLPADLDPGRLGRRRDLLDRLQRGLDDLGPRRGGRASSTATPAGRSTCSARREARRAFRLDEEPEANRDRYGETPFGQSVLLARRLVEAGVRLVQVNWYRGPDEPPANPCWDSHVKESARLKDVLVPPTDRAYSALLEDLDRRGLLDETLVVCMAEFGRTPRLDGNGGRGHWGSVFSVALAGGGVRGGQVYGSSDRIGAYPARAGSGPRTSPPRSSTAWAIARRPSTTTRSAAPTRSAGARCSTPSCNERKTQGGGYLGFPNGTHRLDFARVQKGTGRKLQLTGEPL